MKNETEIEHIFSLFENQNDSRLTNNPVVEACFYFVLHHNFPLDVLPDHLRFSVQHRLDELTKESEAMIRLEEMQGGRDLDM
jgi:hypothetical protein